MLEREMADTSHSRVALYFTKIWEAIICYLQNNTGFHFMAAALNWSFLVLTLGSYGLVLSDAVFWLCWNILIIEAVIFYSILPYWSWIKPYEQQSERPYEASHHGRAGALLLKLVMSVALIIALLYSQDLTLRQTKMPLLCALSIILFEGLTPILIAKETLKSIIENPSKTRYELWVSITQGHNWKASNFLTPSVINAMIIVTGGIVFGGDLGHVMPEKPYWIFASICVVDLLAEAIQRFDCGNRFVFDIPQDLPKTQYVAAIILRLVVEGTLCYMMTQEICEDSYFPSHVDPNLCDGQCQKRSKQLLITMVTLGGFQAIGTVVTPLCSFVLGPHYIPSVIFCSTVYICYGVFCALNKLYRSV